MKEELKKIKQRENSRKYYQAHKEEILAKQYEYKKKKYAEDPEYRKKVYRNSRRWIEKNPEKAYVIKRKWQVEHRGETKDEIIARLQEEIMWLKDEIQDKKDYIAVIEDNNEAYQEELCRTWDTKDKLYRKFYDVVVYIEEYDKKPIKSWNEPRDEIMRILKGE